MILREEAKNRLTVFQYHGMLTVFIKIFIRNFKIAIYKDQEKT